MLYSVVQILYVYEVIQSNLREQGSCACNSLRAVSVVIPRCYVMYIKNFAIIRYLMAVYEQYIAITSFVFKFTRKAIPNVDPLKYINTVFTG
jgi:hypothetical protein